MPHLALSFHLNEVIQNRFVGHVTTEAVVPLQEVRSEVMQERVQVHGVVAVLPAVDTLAALQNTQSVTGGLAKRRSLVFNLASLVLLCMSVCVRAPPGVEPAVMHPRGVWLMKDRFS